MGLREDIQKAVRAGMGATGNLRKEVTFWDKGESVRDTDTRDIVSNDDFYNVKALFVDFEEEKIDNEIIIAGDSQVLIAVLDLEVTPEVDDELEEVESGQFWVVKNKKVDPANSIWTLHVRKR